MTDHTKIHGEDILPVFPDDHAKVLAGDWTWKWGDVPDPTGEPDGEVLQTSSGTAVWSSDIDGGTAFSGSCV